MKTETMLSSTGAIERGRSCLIRAPCSERADSLEVVHEVWNGTSWSASEDVWFAALASGFLATKPGLLPRAGQVTWRSLFKAATITFTKTPVMPWPGVAGVGLTTAS
jgi:hypothetical protein